MKLAAIIAAASTFTALAHAAECDLKLNQAVALPERETCETESGFDFGLTTLATDVIAKFCKSSACVTVWQAAKDVGLPECTIYGKQLYKDVLDPIEAACKSSTAAASGTSSSNSTATKDSRDGSHSSGSMDSSDDDSAVKAPSNSSASTPAPTKSAGVSPASLSLAAVGVVALSIAASFF